MSPIEATQGNDQTRETPRSFAFLTDECPQDTVMALGEVREEEREVEKVVEKNEEEGINRLPEKLDLALQPASKEKKIKPEDRDASTTEKTVPQDKGAEMAGVS